jgi:crotonobetainyl-CoA:carnitine CoA-transferase CaiB-like acyl-CoA transferase
MTTSNLPSLPLAGIRVLDYSHFLAGPHLSRSLGAMGAEVIKIERPKEGDAGRHTPTRLQGPDHFETSGYFLQQNMGKQGLCVNIKDPRGLELLLRLVDSADVFVENYRPGALDKLGLGYAALAKRNPKLIYCSISAFGHTGPDAQRPGFGLIAEARSGAQSLLGMPGEAPTLFRMPIADMYAGMHGVAAVCAALFGRVASGQGRHIDIALHDCMVSMHDYAAQGWLTKGIKPVQTGHDLPSSTVYGTFSAKDGHLVIAAQMADTWRAMARLLGGAAYEAQAGSWGQEERNAHREDILARVRAWCMAQGGVADCCAQLDALGIPAAPVATIDQVMADPQTLARGMVVEQQHPVLGKVRLPNLPFRFAPQGSVPAVAPMLGQHNREIAAGLGFNQEAIDAMVQDGVLYAEQATVKPGAESSGG